VKRAHGLRTFGRALGEFSKLVTADSKCPLQSWMPRLRQSLAFSIAFDSLIGAWSGFLPVNPSLPDRGVSCRTVLPAILPVPVPLNSIFGSGSVSRMSFAAKWMTSEYAVIALADSSLNTRRLLVNDAKPVGV
jgi:hypothetical protein